MYTIVWIRWILGSSKRERERERKAEEIKTEVVLCVVHGINDRNVFILRILNS
jgi:hypothetical protein